MIRTYRPGDKPALLRLWNGAGAKLGYAPQDAEGLDAILTAHPFFMPEHTFVLEEGGQVRGFVNGCTGAGIPRGEYRGYMSCLILDGESDTDENTALLLAALEESFREKGRTEIAVTCFDPIRLPWIIPGTDGCQHNNMPGVAKDIPLYSRMLSLGYTEAGTEQAMYFDLSGYSVPAEILEKERRMAAEGYFVDWYREGVHEGVEEMVAALDNPLWSAEIPHAAHSGMKLLVGLKGNTVAGFTGPVYPQPTGRGYFAGIAVAPEYENHGLGKLLFYRLCEAERDCGARYMSLFTGINNHAANIYRKAGFETRRYFAVMIKAL